MKQDNLLLLGAAAVGAYFLFQSKPVSAYGVTDGPYSQSAALENNPQDLPTDSVQERARKELVRTAYSLGGDIGAKETLEWMRSNPQLSWEEQRMAILGASPSAMATETRILSEEGRGQITVSMPTYTKQTAGDKAAIASISNQGGLASAFSKQVSNQGSLSAMDRQIIKNYQAKASKTSTSSKAVKR